MSDIKNFDEAELLTHYYDQLQTNIDDSERVHTTIPQTVSSFVERQDKEHFSVVSTVEGKETIHEMGGKSEEKPVSDRQELVLSFSDKKNALNQLVEMYKKQGIPEDIAKQMSKEIFAKAESQSPKKVLQIEEIRAESHSGKTETKVVVKSGNQSEEIEISDPEKAISEISEKFEIPEETAIIVVEKAQENIENSADEEEMQSINADEISPESDEFQYDENDIPPMPDWIPDDNDVPPEMPDFSGNFADNVPDIPDIPEAPEINIPTGRGGR